MSESWNSKCPLLHKRLYWWMWLGICHYACLADTHPVLISAIQPQAGWKFFWNGNVLFTEAAASPRRVLGLEGARTGTEAVPWTRVLCPDPSVI